MKKILLRIILLVMIIFTSASIFGFSNQNAEKSSSLSGKITKIIVNRIPNMQQKNQVEIEKIENRMENIVRKLAHYSIYTFFGLLIMLFISTYNLKELDKVSISLISGVIYAITDEIHQLFVPGRSGQITDIMLDSLGILTGIFISLLILELYKRVRSI